MAVAEDATGKNHAPTQTGEGLDSDNSPENSSGIIGKRAKSKRARVFIAISIALCLASLIYAGTFLIDEGEILSHDPFFDTSTASFQLANGSYANFTVERADSADERSLGLMHRNALLIDRGMQFIYPEPTELTFWMKNTLIPLDIIFIAQNGTVMNIEEAAPEPDVADNDLAKYFSLGPVKWVVEINQGLSAQYGIVPGTSVSFPE